MVLAIYSVMRNAALNSTETHNMNKATAYLVASGARVIDRKPVTPQVPALAGMSPLGMCPSCGSIGRHRGLCELNNAEVIEVATETLTEKL